MRRVLRAAGVAVAVMEPDQRVILQVVHDRDRRDGGLPTHVRKRQPVQREDGGEQQQLRDIQGSPARRRTACRAR